MKGCLASSKSSKSSKAEAAPEEWATLYSIRGNLSI